MPKLSLSTLLTSLFYLLPLYLFVIAPLLRQLFPVTQDIFDPDTDATTESDISLDPEILSLPDGIIPTCPEDTYRVHLLSKDPLIIYIEDFLSTSEADHLVKIRSVQDIPIVIPHSPKPQSSTQPNQTMSNQIK